jgi:phosphate starvation-inducible PhoH-like protein
MARFKRKNIERERYEAKPKPYEPKPLVALNNKQKLYLKHLYQSDQVICLGPAGVGKTYLAASVAADLLMQGKIEKIIIVRPTIGADEEIGFLPGGLGSKMEPWVIPFFDVIEERLGQSKMRSLIGEKRIEVVPLAYMRGRTFKNAFVLLDEAQNIKPRQMKMFLTRLGEGSRVVVDGDLSQSDLKDYNGLELVLDLIEDQNLPVPIVEFEKADIVRSGICKIWQEAFDKYEEES